MMSLHVNGSRHHEHGAPVSTPPALLWACVGQWSMHRSALSWQGHALRSSLTASQVSLLLP